MERGASTRTVSAFHSFQELLVFVWKFLGWKSDRLLAESGELTLKLGPSFRFDMHHAAHRMMDEKLANGKIVIEVD